MDGAFVPREAGSSPADAREPVAASRWTDDRSFERTLRGAETRIDPAAWPRVRAALGAWLQDQGRSVFLLPPAEAPPE